jgi:2,3-bisphosphoglycerate-dependent phosphoglycerate mutase
MNVLPVLRYGTHRSRNPSPRFVHTVVLLRHGESLWNKQKKFTGWSDIPLTEAGEVDAKDSGLLLGERKMKFDVAFTSNLERAWRTCAVALSASGQSSVEVIRSWRLNERHYGALQGHSKDSPKLISLFGEETVIEWRRSYLSTPPSVYNTDFLKAMGADSLELCTSYMNPKYLNRNKYFACRRILQHDTSPVSPQFLNELGETDIFPGTESLKQCQDRVLYFWQNTIAPRVRSGEKVLIVAHANTIRALVKAIDGISDEQIHHLRIPNGIPLIYTLDENLQPTDLSDDIGFQANYLVSSRNHSKVSNF